MPTVTNTPSASKARAKSARKTRRKPASAKASTARRARSASAGSTQSKATRAKAARTRATHQTEAALRQTQTATRDTADVFGDYAERAVLIPVGAALIARDRVVSSVSDTISSYSSPSKAQAQLRRFERRGVTARNRLEREIRKTRVRRELEGTVGDLEARRDAVTKNGGDLANRVPELANRVQERILSLV
jgi:hypothetical protein